MSHADVLLWLILLHCLRCLLRVVYHFHNVHNSRLFYLMSSVYHYSNRHSDNGNWQHKEHDDYDTQESEVGRCTIPTICSPDKKLSCSKTRWQVKKINYSIVSTKYWFCITYCSTNRTTIQLFYVWWIQWSVIGCNLTFTCKKKKPFYLPVLTKEVTLIFDFILNARIYHHHSYESSCFSFQWL